MLLILAGLLGRSLDRLLRVNLGFSPERLLVMRVTAPLTGYQGPGEMTRFYRDVVARVQALPGVVAATATSRPPVQEGALGDLTVEGQPRQVAPLALFRRVLPGYFATLGIPLVEGRDFTGRDDGSGEGVVIVSRALARRYWPDGQAVGHRIKVGTPIASRGFESSASWATCATGCSKTTRTWLPTSRTRSARGTACS